MKKKTFYIITVLFSSYTFSQVGIGTEFPKPSSILELSSENLGFLPPRIKLKSNTDIITIPNPDKGIMIYNLTPENNEPGLKYNGMVVWNGEEWRTLSNLYLGDSNVQELDCANAKLYPPTYNVNIPYNGTLEIPYIGANGGLYPATTLGPANGLTASIGSGNLLTGSGSLQYNVTGIPLVGSPSTTTFTITINGKSCEAIIGAGNNIDQGGSVYHKVPDISASISGSGDQYNGTQNIGWFSHYDENLPIIGGKLRVDGYFNTSSNTVGAAVSWNPRLVNITNEPVKFWFSSFSSQENFDGSNIVLSPGAYFNLDNGVYLDRGNNNTITNPTTVNYNGGASRNEIITLDFALDDKWYRAFYFPIVDNQNNANTNTSPEAVRKIFISVQRLY